MSEANYFSFAVAVLVIAVICALIQNFFKKYLESDQYYYLKDISLIGAWALFGIWMPRGLLRMTIAAGVVAACIGFCQKVTKGRSMRFMYFLIGLGFAFFGPRIPFIELSDGTFYFLSKSVSVIVSTLIIGVFPIFFQELDETPGLCGLLLISNWLLYSVAILSSVYKLHDVSQVCFTGIIFLIVFSSRHIHAYRRLTEPLTAFWGTLIAALFIYASSNGVAFGTLATITVGIYILPIIEVAISVLSAVMLPNPIGNMIIYRKFLRRGMDHAGAVHCFALICTVCGCIATYIVVPDANISLIIAIAALLLVVTWLFFKYLSRKNYGESSRRPELWGITVDNISLNYAMSKVQHWINNERKPQIIVTLDALAALRSRKDKKYSSIVKQSGLVLPDGVGLMAALKILKTPIQERLPGVEFVEHLCKRSAYEGWKIWLFGGVDGVAEKAAAVLSEKYPGLNVCGYRNGYFADDETDQICENIRMAQPDIIFVGFGVPKQEYWLSENLEKTGAIVGIGIGGSMDVITGNLKRAPLLWQKMGLEWLYRTIQEPKRIKRIIKLPVFVFFVFLTLLKIDPYEDYDVKIKN